MNGIRAFWDTNIFVYMYSEDEAKKREVGIATLDIYARFTSTQAINELSNVFTKKYRLPISKVRQLVHNIESTFQIELITPATIEKALDTQERYGYSYYDCLMLASALEGDCDIILTEDMSDGQIIEDKLQIVNPFRRA